MDFNGNGATTALDLETERQSMNEMLGLPDLSSHLDPDGDAAFSEGTTLQDGTVEHSKPRFWEQPTSHIAFIGIAGALVVGLGLSLYNSIGGGGTETKTAEKPANKNDFFSTLPSDGTGDWKTQAALAEQKAQFQNRNKPTPMPSPKTMTVVKPNLPQRIAPPPTYIPRSLPVAAAAPATPQIFTPPAPAFTPTISAPPIAPPAPPPSFDETQKKWEALGKIASWGAEDNGMGAGGYTPAIATQPTPPTAQFVSNPAPVPAPVAAEETAILTGVAPKAVQVGTRVPGKLETPIVFQPPTQGAAPDASRFVVSLKKPLLATDGSVILPQGAQLIVKIDAVGSSGLMQLSAISASSPNGEIQLPPGAIVVRGNQGKPLIAKDASRKGNGFLKNLAMFALGGISRGAQLFNQADQSILSTGTSTIVTSQYPQPNYLAGVLEGGTQSVIPGLQQSLQSSSNSYTSGPLWAIGNDVPVEIFVNQTVSI